MNLGKINGIARLLSFVLFPAALAGQAGSGIVAAELDQEFGDFLAYSSSATAPAHEALPFSGRVVLKAVDEEGRAVPFAEYRLSIDGKPYRAGRAFADGSFPIYPSDDPALPAAGEWRVELSCRGAAGVARSLPVRAAGASLGLMGPRAPPSPLPCDIVFILDTTESMAKILPSLRKAIVLARERIVSARPGLALRTGLVLFRDRGDEYLTRVFPLEGDIPALDTALAGAVGAGGGDAPEALGAGLKAAVSGMDWARDGSRLAFVFTDAAPSSRAETGDRYSDAARAALAAGVKVCAIGLGKPDSGGEFALRQISAWTGSVYVAADRPDGRAYGPFDGGASAGVVRGALEDIIARLAVAEADAAGPGGGLARDPALTLLDAVQARMASRLKYPEIARMRGISGTARVALRVAPDGRLLRSRVAVSSSSAILDKAALDLARSAFPISNPASCEIGLEIAVMFALE